MIQAPTRLAGETRLESLVRVLGVDPVLEEFDEDEWQRVLYDWEWNSRENQTEPEGDWRVWLIQAGRGWGKTRCGAEWIRKHAENQEPFPMYLIGRTASDMRDVMVEGVSGILKISAPDFRPHYQPSLRKLTWPNGVEALTRTADEPDTLRGPNASKSWCDELASWKYPEAFDQVQMMTRVGRSRLCVTTTPRPTKLIRDLVKDEFTKLTRGVTAQNLKNLDQHFIKYIYNKYKGTRLGKQELEGELLGDTPGALWKQAQFDEEGFRVSQLPDLERVCVAVDPAVKDPTQSKNDDPDDKGAETGIVTAGRAICNCKGFPEMHGFVLGDVSDHYSPNEWAKKVAEVYHQHDADRVVAEINNGGALVESNIRTLGDRNISYLGVHAARGKHPRAEPVAALYEQKKVHHLGVHAALEDQMTTWQPLKAKKSPDRMDALVWALTWLMVQPIKEPGKVGMMVIGS